jgi:putative hydrolase of the HAD superfamily
MKQYKAIFLDWDDTIGDWTNAEHLALRDIYTTYHLDHLYASFDDYLAAYKPYNLELWGRYGRGEISKQYLHFERFYRPLLIQDEPELCGLRKDELAHRIGDEFLRLTNTYFRLMPDADRVVRYLASKYPLTIVSNGFKEVQYYKFEHSGLSDCLTHTLVSDEIGINKPQPEIFRIALERNGVKADEAIMIGDSYSSDIAGAKAAGIDQIWLHDGETSETATFIVPRLTDIMNIL